MKEELIKELVANSKFTNRINIQYQHKIEALQKEILQYKCDITDLQSQVQQLSCTTTIPLTSNPSKYDATLFIILNLVLALGKTRSNRFFLF
jgi:hypothetical protein